MGDGLTDGVLASLYDWEHDDFRDDISLYRAFALRTGGPILELACGSGRVMEALADDGLEVVGIDCSTAMLERASKRLSRFGGRASLVRGDINRDFPDGRYSLILAPLDGFGCSPNIGCQVGLLRRVGGALSQQGLFVLDLLNAASLEGQLQETPILQRSGHWDHTDAHVEKWVVRHVSAAEETVDLHCLYDVTSRDHQLRRYAQVVQLRFFSRFEVELLLRAARLTIEAVYGGYDLQPFSDSSERLIVVAKRDEGAPDVEAATSVHRQAAG